MNNASISQHTTRDLKHEGKRPKVLFLLSGGGYRFETLRIAQGLQEVCEVVFVRSEGCKADCEDIGRLASIALPSVSTMEDTKTISLLWRLFVCMVKSIALIWVEKPRWVIASGTAQAIPVFAVARLMRVNTIFVESITRVTTETRTGKIVSRYRLAKMMLVQWPEAVGLYPRARYLGNIL
jgi:UDP-N-acetylglucosamine:LPS N-acetylglucosamine transferase